MADPQPLDGQGFEHVISIVEGEVNGYLTNTAKFVVDRNPAELLRNRIRYQEHLLATGVTPDVTAEVKKALKKERCRERQTARHNGEQPEYEVDLFEPTQTTFSVTWQGGTLVGGQEKKPKELWTSAERSQDRRERRQRAKERAREMGASRA